MVFKTYIYFHDDFTKEIDYYVNKISYKKDKWCSEYQKNTSWRTDKSKTTTH